MKRNRTDSAQRYQCAYLICSYMLSLNTSRAVVTSREIALFHNLSRKSSQAISALLNFLYTNHIRQARFGFYILGTRPFHKCDYPHHYTVELIEEGRGLLWNEVRFPLPLDKESWNWDTQRFGAFERNYCVWEPRMTRTWLQWLLQRNDTDLLSYDFAESCPAWESWWFRCGSAAAGISLAFWLLQ